MTNKEKSGPLKGFKIIEFAGLGPAPFAGMMLSDMGAEILQMKKNRLLSKAPNQQAQDQVH